MQDLYEIVNMKQIALPSKITHDLQSGISCLTKLSGGNLNNPSHTWELFDIQIPAMTLGQRIEALRKYYRAYPKH